MMEKPESMSGGTGISGERVVTAMDEAAALSEVLDLLFWAAEGVGGAQGAAMARGAMVARERLDALRCALMTGGEAAAQ